MKTQWRTDGTTWQLHKGQHHLHECDFVMLKPGCFVMLETSEHLPGDVEKAKHAAYHKGLKVMVARYLAFAYAGTDLKY